MVLPAVVGATESGAAEAGATEAGAIEAGAVEVWVAELGAPEVEAGAVLKRCWRLLSAPARVALIPRLLFFFLPLADQRAAVAEAAAAEV